MIRFGAVGMNSQITAVHAKFTPDFFDNRPQRTLAVLGKRIGCEIQQTINQLRTNRKNTFTTCIGIRKIGKRPLKADFRLADFPAFQGAA